MNRSALRDARELAALSWRADPGGTALSIGLMLLNTFNDVAMAFWLKLVTDGIVQHDPSRALVGAAGMGSVTVFFVLGALWNSLLSSRIIQKAFTLAEEQLLDTVARLPGLEHLERPDYLNHIDLLRSHLYQIVYSSWWVLGGLMTVIQVVLTCLMLASVHPVLLLLVLFVVPTAWTSVRSTKEMHQLDEKLAEPSRAEEHLFGLAVQHQSAKELRVFGLEDEIVERRRTLYDRITGARLRVQMRMQAKQGIGMLIYGAGYLSAIVLAAWRASKGLATAGDVVMVLTAGGGLSGQLSSLISMGTSSQRFITGLRKYRWLMDYADSHIEDPTTGNHPPNRLETGLTLQGVSFTYPGTTTPVLHDLNLHIPAGSVVALVGENGAGKTSLIKLLCRFYEPTDGTISVDNIPLATIPADEWRQYVSAGFQDFARFEFRMRTAVGVGDMPHVDSPEAVAAAIHRAGASDVVNATSDGLDTQLGRTFAGTELSGGQWQKLALSRAMMRETPLLFILDEPTAALDPAAEHHLFEQYASGARRLRDATGAVTLFVSHRFSTVRMADLIVVLRDGRIEDMGSHHELMSREGLYAELYELQARAYQ